MRYILSLETATRVCSVAVHSDGQLLAEQTYHLEKSHSSFLPLIVDEILSKCELTINSLDAFAISSGPGSYTGLRIGVSTAKGFCFATSKPLISVSTLEAMVRSLVHILPEAYLCPMIDARRMEVYTLVSRANETIWSPRPLIVEESSFASFSDAPVVLFGDGAAKTREVLNQSNIRWIDGIFPTAANIGTVAHEKFMKGEFENVAYFEPDYIKEFQTKPAKKLL